MCFAIKLFSHQVLYGKVHPRDWVFTKLSFTLEDTGLLENTYYVHFQRKLNTKRRPAITTIIIYNLTNYYKIWCSAKIISPSWWSRCLKQYIGTIQICILIFTGSKWCAIFIIFLYQGIELLQSHFLPFLYGNKLIYILNISWKPIFRDISGCWVLYDFKPHRRLYCRHFMNINGHHQNVAT